MTRFSFISLEKPLVAQYELETYLDFLYVFVIFLIAEAFFCNIFFQLCFVLINFIWWKRLLEYYMSLELIPYLDFQCLYLILFSGYGVNKYY